MTTVLMTTDTVGGVWTYSLDLTHALAARSVDVALAVVGPPPTDAQRRELDAAPVIASYDLGGSLEWMEDPWLDVDRVGQSLLDIAADVRPDVVHLGSYSFAALPWEVPTVAVAHSDVLSWWRAVHGCAAPDSWGEYARRLRSGVQSADLVVAPTAAALRALRREVTVDRGVVIHNGRRSGWERHLAKEPVVLSAGRMWDRAKNVAALEAVAASIEWDVEVASSLPFDELAARLGRAAVYASPARYEPFGLGVLEAAMSGCALVLGDIASFHEVWGDAATYVDPDGDRALRNALDGLAHDAERRRELGRRALQRSRRYRIDRVAMQYESCYRSLAGAEVRAG